MSRADLARRSGLSTTSITAVISRLLDAGHVVERVPGETEPRVGRPPIEVALVPESLAVCGIQIGVGIVRIGICDAVSSLVRTDGFDFDVSEPAERVLGTIADRIRGLTSAMELGTPLLGIGVATPSTVDLEQRRTVMSLNLGWNGVDIAGQLEGLLSVPTVIDHNVRAMALAEARYGIGRGVPHLAYVYVRTGIGAGLVIQGEPFRGGMHGGSELGHLRVVEKGRLCKCGATGCLETVVSEPRLTEQVDAVAAANPGGAVAHAMRSSHNLLDVLEIASGADDDQAGAILDDLVGHLAPALASLVNLLNPELIVLGGIFADAPETTYDRVRRALRAEAFPLLRDAVSVERTTLGLDAGIVGGAAVALDHLFYSPETSQQ